MCIRDRWRDVSLEKFYLKDFQIFWIYSSAVAYGAYFGLGGILHVSKSFYYIGLYSMSMADLEQRVYNTIISSSQV